jgi:SAM-dependent methyltransferase
VNAARYLDYRIAALFRTHLRRREALVLEAGAGASVWLTFFAQEFGYRVVGLDYSRIGCEMAWRNLEPVRERALVLEGDIFQPCFAPQTFDMIFSNGLIEHFTNYGQVLEGMSKWLKPSGMLITFVPNKKYAFRHIERRIAPDVYDHHVLLGPEDLAAAYREIGLENVSSFYFGSFSTWKYTSYLRGAVKTMSQVASRMANAAVQTPLRLTGLMPESRLFSPLVVAVGTVPARK